LKEKMETTVVTKMISWSTAYIEAFAKAYGLTNLTSDHLERMRELAPSAARLGGQLPRPKHKSDVPAPSFRAMPSNNAKLAK
jgi:hypothetical protein